VAVVGQVAAGSAGVAVDAPAGLGRRVLVNDGTGRRTELLDSHADYLRQRWNQGCTDAARLWEELRGPRLSEKLRHRPLKTWVEPPGPPPLATAGPGG
jgi:hypothetical protein